MSKLTNATKWLTLSLLVLSPAPAYAKWPTPPISGALLPPGGVASPAQVPVPVPGLTLPGATYSPSGDTRGDRRPCFFFQSDVAPGQWWAIPYGDGTSVAQLAAATENVRIVTNGQPYTFIGGAPIAECDSYPLASAFQQ